MNLNVAYVCTFVVDPLTRLSFIMCFCLFGCFFVCLFVCFILLLFLFCLFVLFVFCFCVLFVCLFVFCVVCLFVCLFFSFLGQSDLWFQCYGQLK